MSKWTKDLPAKPGYYWLKNYKCKVLQSDPRFSERVETEPAIVQVQHKNYDETGLHFWAVAVELPFSFDELIGGEWYGPLTPPATED